VELVALLREREAKIDELGVRVVQYAESASMWQARAAVFAHQLEGVHAELRALKAPEPRRPDPDPQPNPPSPNAAPSRWRRWWLALAGAGLVG